MIGYHATDVESGISIIFDGKIKRGSDGVVYFCKTPEDANKFLAIRMVNPIWVFQFVVPDEEVEESFDHSEAFFKCKAYCSKVDIPTSSILEANVWERKGA